MAPRDAAADSGKLRKFDWRLVLRRFEYEDTTFLARAPSFTVAATRRWAMESIPASAR
jgi:hypothetical protein